MASAPKKARGRDSIMSQNTTMLNIKQQHEAGPLSQKQTSNSQQLDIRSLLINGGSKATKRSFLSSTSLNSFSQSRKVLGIITNKQPGDKSLSPGSSSNKQSLQKQPIIIDISEEDDENENFEDTSDEISVTKEDEQLISKSQDGVKHKTQINFNDPYTYYQHPIGIENFKNVIDFDLSELQPKGDPFVFGEPHYAWDIFLTERQKELKHRTIKYLNIGGPKTYEINPKMRAVLVDWMIQMQDSLALNHEPLYMAVKIVDQFLMRKPVPRQTLQLLGLVALLISCKFDERIPPEIDEFLDNTNRAYSRRQVIHFEAEVLKTLKFDISFALSYRFLRRYARCTGCDMRTLTLSRYILESSLLEYELIEELESKVSAASLLLALKMIDHQQGGWSETAEFYTQYKESELMPIVQHLNTTISKDTNRRCVYVRTKYENPVFLSVAKIAPLSV